MSYILFPLGPAVFSEVDFSTFLPGISKLADSLGADFRKKTGVQNN